MPYRCSSVCFILLFFLVICIKTDFSTLEQKNVIFESGDDDFQSSVSCTCAYVMKV